MCACVCISVIVQPLYNILHLGIFPQHSSRCGTIHKTLSEVSSLNTLYDKNKSQSQWKGLISPVSHTSVQLCDCKLMILQLHYRMNSYINKRNKKELHGMSRFGKKVNVCLNIRNFTTWE